MSIKELDEHCKKLLVTFITSNKKWHFNDFLDKYGHPRTPLQFTKPTLSKHLDHLEELNLITKKKEDKQRITYEANWRKLGYLHKTVESQNALKRITENQKTFESFPIEEQVIFLTNALSLRNLQELELEILNTLEPRKNFEYSVQYAITHQFFDLFKRGFMEKLGQTTSENKLIALKMVENNIKHFEENLFTKKPWKT